MLQPILQRLRNTATVIFSVLRPLDAPLGPVPLDLQELADDQDFETLGGSRALLDHASVPRPALLLDEHAPLPHECDAAQTETHLQDPGPTDMLEELLRSVAEPFSGAMGEDGLQAYLAAQMRPMPDYEDSAEMDWAALVLGLQ